MRRAQDPSVSARLSFMIKQRLFSLEEFKLSVTVMAYVSTCDEVATDKIISCCLAGGKRVAVPSLRGGGDEIVPSLISDPEKELAPGLFGIMEPASEYVKPVPLDEIDIVIVPGAAFDASGSRLGLGGGYYDRLLKKLPRPAVIALAFNFQVLESLPVQAHDVAVDKLITESSVIDCSSNRRLSCCLKVKSAVLLDPHF